MSLMMPAPEPMTEDTIFDLASLTKVLATAPAVMQLYEQGRFRLKRSSRRYLPSLPPTVSRTLPIRQYAHHYSGLLLMSRSKTPSVEAKTRDCGARLRPSPGDGSRSAIPPTSDINFIVLGALVEKLSGLTLDEYRASGYPRGTPGCGAHAISPASRLAQSNSPHAIR